ncbi:hypothetical protein DFH08DRAFT_821338 [Mycena albidolilacea]|uniref:Uncharacterized protein n=1 Tax=Mycena albidolilacea TaxID=1033008 RepID=A0AAD6ZAK2_9AGAR|nr:hypothetical protein DFH08DRAFT_821338 [Mycena albidolilacea]
MAGEGIDALLEAASQLDDWRHTSPIIHAVSAVLLKHPSSAPPLPRCRHWKSDAGLLLYPTDAGSSSTSPQTKRGWPHGSKKKPKSEDSPPELKNEANSLAGVLWTVPEMSALIQHCLGPDTNDFFAKLGVQVNKIWARVVDANILPGRNAGAIQHEYEALLGISKTFYTFWNFTGALAATSTPSMQPPAASGEGMPLIESLQQPPEATWWLISPLSPRVEINSSAWPSIQNWNILISILDSRMALFMVDRCKRGTRSSCTAATRSATATGYCMPEQPPGGFRWLLQTL